MSNKYRVSQSKVKTFRRCHAAYHYKYVEELRKKRRSRPLQFGTMVHEMLERHCNGDDPFSYLAELKADPASMKMFRQEQDEFGDILEDVEDIMTDYFDFHEGDENLHFLRKKRRSAEHHFEIELMPDVIWNGKIDTLVRTSDGLTWLGEHKSFKRRPGDDDRWRSMQGATYIRANDILGWKPVDGLWWDYIRSKAPATPTLLANKTLSGRKLDTVVSRIRRVMDERGDDDKNYPKLLSDAEKNRGQYFHRIFAAVQSHVTDTIFEDFETTVREMVRGHGKVSDMNIDMHCSWCDYEPLCRAKLQGLDMDFVKEREYDNADKTQKASELRKPKEDTIHKAIVGTVPVESAHTKARGRKER
jgi:hypothetical protein